jgi:KTSC domain/Transposase DDE domain
LPSPSLQAGLRHGSRRYANAAYQDSSREPVDVVVFHDPQFKEPWFLLVPAGSEAQLPTDDVVGLYRERMHIELTFRDWKTHLGVRGLRLEVDAPARRGRLLLALSIAYILAVLLGAGEIARRVRATPRCCVRNPDMEPGVVWAPSPSASSRSRSGVSMGSLATNWTACSQASNAACPPWSYATLELEFRSGAIYRYFAVPQAVVEGLIAAESKGAYFNRNVRSRFPYHRLA